MTSQIHPTAIIEPTVILGKDLIIEPYAVIKGNVELGDRVVVKAHAYLEGHVSVGHDTVIWPSASIGTQTQALKFQGEKTYVKIGHHCQIREFVTINSSFDEGDTVSIGDHCLIMAYCHIAHHCSLGSHVVMSNAVNLAGHVEIGDYVTIGGMSAFHQHTRVGRYAMVGGMSRVTKDVPPFTIGGGIPYKMGGINLIGLKRRGFSLEHRQILSQLFKITYRTQGNKLRDRLEIIQREFGENPFGIEWVEFCLNSQRGLIDLEKITEDSYL